MAHCSPPHKLFFACAQRNLFHLCLLQPHSIVCVGFISATGQPTQLLSHLIQRCCSPFPLDRIVLSITAPYNFSLRISNPAPPILRPNWPTPYPYCARPALTSSPRFSHQAIAITSRCSPVSVIPSLPVGAPLPPKCPHRLALCCRDTALPPPSSVATAAVCSSTPALCCDSRATSDCPPSHNALVPTLARNTARPSSFASQPSACCPPLRPPSPFARSCAASDSPRSTSPAPYTPPVISTALFPPPARAPRRPQPLAHDGQLPQFHQRGSGTEEEEPGN